MARIAPPLIVTNATTVETVDDTDCDLTSTLAALELSAKERKAYVVTMPWKVRLRILNQLLKLLVEQEKQEVDDSVNESRQAVSPAVKEFIDTFLPEVSISIFRNVKPVIHHLVRTGECNHLGILCL